MGSLFYPCCGSDIDHAMSAFGPYVLDCHFADPYQTVRNRSRRARNLKKISVPGVEDVVVGGAGGERIDNAACVAYSHAKDGLLTLIEDIGALSVFYYRGDSGGEGGAINDGSDQFCFTRYWPDCWTEASSPPMARTAALPMRANKFSGRPYVRRLQRSQRPLCTRIANSAMLEN
jgi:hypothetical protein